MKDRFYLICGTIFTMISIIILLMWFNTTDTPKHQEQKSSRIVWKQEAQDTECVITTEAQFNSNIQDVLADKYPDEPESILPELED